MHQPTAPGLRKKHYIEGNYRGNYFVFQLEFAISDSRAREILSIDKLTGEVSVFGNLDYEQKRQIKTVVELRSATTNTIYDFALVTIDIRDINDNTPTIQYQVIEPAILRVSLKIILSTVINCGFLPARKSGHN